jgi:hypothetical protein
MHDHSRGLFSTRAACRVHRLMESNTLNDFCHLKLDTVLQHWHCSAKLSDCFNVHSLYVCKPIAWLFPIAGCLTAYVF